MIACLVFLFVFVFIAAEKQKKDIVLVVNSVPWHHEVALWATCSLKSLGLTVHAFINTDGSSTTDSRFHEMCADKIVVVPKGVGNFSYLLNDYHNYASDKIQTKPSLKLMVLVTFSNDMSSLARMRIFDPLIERYAEHWMVVSHNSHSIEHAAIMCRIDKNCTVAHLGDHVNDKALAELTNTLHRRHKVHVTTMYPIVKHPEVIIDEELYAKDYSVSTVSERRSAVIQGTVSKRDFTQIFKCMEKIHNEDQIPFDLKIVGKGVEDMTKSYNQSLEPYIHRYGKLANLEFYNEIANSSFLAAYLFNGMGHMYNESSATSCVAVGLISGLPIVTTAHLLSKYQCLKSSRIHQMVAKETDCESLTAAVKLTPAEYHEFKREAIMCRDYLSWQTRLKFSGIMHATMPKHREIDDSR